MRVADSSRIPKADVKNVNLQSESSSSEDARGYLSP